MAKKTKPFDTSMFQATKFHTADDKAWFGNHLLAFIEAGFPESKFTKAFYNMLCQRFGFIAHYDRNGFWSTYFTTTVDKIEFVKHILEHPCWGSAEYTFSDVEKAVKSVLLESGVLGRYEAQNRSEIEQVERRTLARLKAKYEPDNGPAVIGEHIPPLADFLSAPETSEVPEAPAVQGLLF